MDIASIKQAYRRYAKRYDWYFGRVLQPGRQSVVERMCCRAGERILEVGVGTGLSLPLYPAHTRVWGIDISPEMLAQARARVVRMGLAQVEGLARMDGERMAFADDSFDHVVAMYVVSVVPNPERLIAEMRRVCRPDGALYIVNHFLQEQPLLARLERAAAPLSRYLGFRTDLSLKDLIERTRLDVVECARVNAFGCWTLLRARNDKLSPRVAAADTATQLTASATGAPQPVADAMREACG
ncbi:MAG: methyltransferase domain-containing protein [Thiobacillaceae bacterium]|nr:methyltransferase domain-containing protein [Thiobacillaceae bacterium]